MNKQSTQAGSSTSINGQQYGQTTYGDAIPSVIGRTRAALKLIWANGHRKGHSGKKLKQSKKKGAQAAYVQNCDFLITTAPLFDMLTLWRNKDIFAPTQFQQSGTIASNSFTITNCPGGHVPIAVLAVTVTETYAQLVNDFGGPGPSVLSGTDEIPCYCFERLLPPVYSQSRTSQFPFPYVYSAAGFSSGSPSITFNPGTFSSLNGKVCTVYYDYADPNKLPLTELNLELEPVLGQGSEYANFPAEQLYYQDLAGCGTDALDLGSADSIPTLTAEITGGYTFNKFGEALPTDILQFILSCGDGASDLYTAENFGNYFPQNMLCLWDSVYRSAYYVAPGEPTTPASFFEPTTLALARDFCMANGIFLVENFTEQQNATEYVQDVIDCMNVAPVWSGFQLKLVPYSEVSAYGNGVLYTPQSASGPVAAFDRTNFKVTKGGPALKVTRVPQPQASNIVPIQHIDSANQYNTALSAWQNQADIFVRGPFTDDTRTLNCIQRIPVAQSVASMMVQKNTTLLATYDWAAGIEYDFLEPMDVVTVLCPDAGVATVRPVRITKVTENEAEKQIQFTAEDFFYGTNAPSPAAMQVTSNQSNTTNAAPGNISDFVIFDCPARLKTTPAQLELILACCSPDPNWGGAAVFVSNDNFATTSELCGTIGLGCTMGLLTQDYPLHVDPDTTNDLFVDLSESNGSLTSATTAQQNNFASLAFLSGASSYEIVGYGTVSFVGSGVWELHPTIRRAFLNTSAIDHPIGSHFALIDNTVLHVAVDPNWVGETLYFKFCSFNTYGQNQQSLSAVTAVTYAPNGQGIPQAQYSITPQITVTQPSGGGVGSLVVSSFDAAFSTGNVHYDGATISIGVPVSPTQYWVTVQDPGQVGEGGGNPALTYFADVNPNRANSAGFTYCGTIIATATGGVTGTAGGSQGPR